MRCPYCIKVCSKCNKILIAYKGNFYKKKGGKYGLRTECKDCHSKDRKQYFKQYYEDNKEYYKQYYEDNKERISERNKQYYQDNKEYLSEYHKQWTLNNPDKLFNIHNKRRQLENNQGRGISKDQWLEMMSYFDWKCAYSGEKLTDNTRTIDHIIPLGNGGLNEPWNCIPMVKNYNKSKKTQNMIDWYTQQDFYDEARLNKIYEWIEYAYNKWNSD